MGVANFDAIQNAGNELLECVKLHLTNKSNVSLDGDKMYKVYCILYTSCYMHYQL